MIDISGILDDVVHQFRDPLAFFRELVQNAIDAGTGEVAIDIAHDGDVMTATVRDFGGGMDREIIETQLCRLFSSSKYEDLTAIGRFGIGFISVYGIDPDFVCVDTGRHGESWRVLFLPDRTYELYDLRHPVEGTTVRVVKTMTVEEFAEFETRAREVIRRWCRHVRTPVLLDGADQREPFEVSSPIGVDFAEEGTRIVAGLVAEAAPLCGYFNRGLMLKEQAGGPWPHFTFKIDSRYLDHTLTRDDLLRDRNYRKGLDMLEGFATRELPAALLRELEEPTELERRGELYEILRGLEAHMPITVKDWRRRRLFHGPSGSHSAADLLAAHERGELWLTPTLDRLGDAVARRGDLVVAADRPETLGALLAIRPQRLHDHWFMLDPEPLPPAVADELQAVFEQLGVAAATIGEASLGGSRRHLATTVADLETPCRRVDLDGRPRLGADRHLVFNSDHDLTRHALRTPSTTAAALLVSGLFGDLAEEACASIAERRFG